MEAGEGLAPETGRQHGGVHIRPALYRSAGYVEIGDYNGNPNATAWLERRLRSR